MEEGARVRCGVSGGKTRSFFTIDRPAVPDGDCGCHDSGESHDRPSHTPATRVRAADSVLKHTAKAIEVEDVGARVSDVERALEAAKQQGKF